MYGKKKEEEEEQIAVQGHSSVISSLTIGLSLWMNGIILFVVSSGVDNTNL